MYLSIVCSGLAVTRAVVLDLVEPGGDLVTPVWLSVVGAGGRARRPGARHVLANREPPFEKKQIVWSIFIYIVHA